VREKKKSRESKNVHKRTPLKNYLLRAALVPEAHKTCTKTNEKDSSPESELSRDNIHSILKLYLFHFYSLVVAMIRRGERRAFGV
jgi:hypothetical protein